MKNSNIIALNKQEEIDLLQSILKDRAQRMLAVAIESEVEWFIDKNRSFKTANDKAAIVRNGYLP
jgi:putative transposase